MKLIIKPALKTHINAAHSILIKAREWQIETKRPEVWSDKIYDQNLLIEATLNKELFLAFLDGTPVGTIIFNLKDELIWPDFPERTSGYLHKFSVKRTVAGTGVADSILEWAKNKAKELNLSTLRCDCYANLDSLVQYYVDRDFKKHSIFQHPTINKPMMRLEKQL